MSLRSKNEFTPPRMTDKTIHVIIDPTAQSRAAERSQYCPTQPAKVVFRGVVEIASHQL
jgi:hypothetical protein